MTDPIYKYDHLQEFAFAIFKNIGCPVDQAILATEVLLKADLRGIDSHGIARLSGYVRLWDKKRVNSNPDIRIVHETPSTDPSPAPAQTRPPSPAASSRHWRDTGRTTNQLNRMEHQ